MNLFDSQSLDILRRDIDIVLEAVAEKHNINLHAGNIKYSDNSCTIKVEASVNETKFGESFDKGESDFKRHCAVFDLNPETFGKRFLSKGYVFQITGLKPRSRKYPVVAIKVATNQSYKFSWRYILRLQETGDWVE